MEETNRFGSNAASEGGARRWQNSSRPRTVVITGASRGIGAACARLFAQRGDRVVICYHTSEQSARELAAELNGMPPAGQENGAPIRAIALQADVSKADQVEALFAAARAVFGTVDVLVNNAGISEFALFTDISEEQWDRMMNTNCKGMFLCAKEALKDMISEKSGAIVNVSSMWGQVGSSCEVHYSASKAAVIGMTKALAKELGPSRIRVNCVAPGAIETDMMAEVAEDIKREMAEETPLMRLGTPEDIARTIWFLASDEAGFITGQVIGASGGFVI